MSNNTKIIVNNRLVDISNKPITFALQSAAEIFKDEQVMIRTKQDGSLTQLSESVLDTMGITMITADAGEGSPSFSTMITADAGERSPSFSADFSLVGDRNNDRGIDNSSIMDPDINTLTPELIDAKDKFLAADDPFYEQDEVKTQKQINHSRRKSKTIKTPLLMIAKDMCMPHLSHQVKNQNRYFINKNVSSRRGKR